MAETDLLSRALDHHKSSRLENAKALYLRILDENPDDPDALNYLGVFECQLRRFDQAEELINRSPALRPAAQSLRASGRGENALSGIFHNAGP